MEGSRSGIVQIITDPDVLKTYGFYGSGSETLVSRLPLDLVLRPSSAMWLFKKNSQTLSPEPAILHAIMK
jgi:hypothetical protein